MTTFLIKLIAVVTMVIDHVGLFFFPDHFVFRIIGRISFPLFAWLVANGARHTKNGDRYLKRLGLLALVSQVPFFLVNRSLWWYPAWFFNVLFTLSLGLAVILIIQKNRDNKIRLVSFVVAACLAYAFNVDYGPVGVAAVVCFYLFYNSWSRMALAQIAVFGLPILYNCIYKIYLGEAASIAAFDFNSLVALASLGIIYFYNGQEGKKAQYWFYVIYPLQYVVILIAQLLIKRYAN